jgi:UDP-3-O-[3-hydroxymyristoyl] glucosamine N-acyltransferase
MKTEELGYSGIKYVYRHGVFRTCGFMHQKKNGLLSFIESEKFLGMLKSPFISAVICTEELIDKIEKCRNDIGIIVSDNPRELLFKISSDFKPRTFESIIHKTARISSTAIISPYNVFIGSNVIIDEGVIIRENTIIRDNARIGAGTMLGPEGLMVYTYYGIKHIASHNGFLYINRDAVVLCNVIIERAVFHGDITFIGSNAVLDSGVSISHGCSICDGVVVGANSKICGYTKIGANSYIGPGSTISNNLIIGEKCKIRIGSTVISNLADGADVSSSFALEHQANMMNSIRILKGR